jgi:hypothetical protein
MRCDAVITGYREIEPDDHTEERLQKAENAPFFIGVTNGGNPYIHGT